MAINISGGIQVGSKIAGGASTTKNMSGNTQAATTKVIEELEFKSHLEFPNIGEVGKLYIATDENKIYRFNVDTLSYVRCSGDKISDVQLIQCIL